MKATLVTCIVWPLVTPQESSLKSKTGGAELWVEGVHTAKGHLGPAYPVHTQTLAGSFGQPSQRLGAAGSLPPCAPLLQPSKNSSANCSAQQQSQKRA